MTEKALKAEKLNLKQPQNTATDEPLVQPGACVRHRKGGEYTVIGPGRFESSWEKCVIYQAKDGTLVVRSLAEFIDGRFTLVRSSRIALASPPTPSAEGEVEKCISELSEIRRFFDKNPSVLDYLEPLPSATLGDTMVLLRTLLAERDGAREREKDLEELRQGVASMVLADVNGGKANCLHNECKWDAATYVRRARELEPTPAAPVLPSRRHPNEER